METVEAVKARADVMVHELTAQRNDAMDKCAVLSAQLRMALAKIKEFEEQNAAKAEAPTNG